jgi:hypothetical protein
MERRSLWLAAAGGAAIVAAALAARFLRARSDVDGSAASSSDEDAWGERAPVQTRPGAAGVAGDDGESDAAAPPSTPLPSGDAPPARPPAQQLPPHVLLQILTESSDAEDVA